MSNPIPDALPQAAVALGTVLHWPGNLGIEFRHLRLSVAPETAALAVFIQGLADEELVRLLAIEPLERAAAAQARVGRLTPEALEQILPAPRLSRTTDLPTAVEGILAGATALFLDGAAEALLVQTEAQSTRAVPDMSPEVPYREVFGLRLADNVALLRRRLRDPALVAEVHPLPKQRETAVVYLKGQTDARLINQMHAWLTARAGEPALPRGFTTGVPGRFGLLPDLMSTAWPDKVIPLLKAGYVVALQGGLPEAYIAPITAGAILYGPGDDNLPRPLAAAMVYARLLRAGLVLGVQAVVVALLNYHLEMFPTPFMLALASQRESAALPIVAEVVLLEIIQELIRVAALRLPLRIKPGHALMAALFFNLLALLAGMVGPTAALASAVVAIASFGLPSDEVIYLARCWRWPMILGAVLFGLMGATTVAFFLAVYLYQAESFGRPFLGPAGVHRGLRATLRQRGGHTGAREGSVQ